VLLLDPSSVPNGNPGMVFARDGRHGERKLTTKAQEHTIRGNFWRDRPIGQL